MKTELIGSTLRVNREGKKYYTESAWWHDLKEHLNAQGYDLVKKVMSKDGHMVGGDDYPYYLRDRKWAYCFHDVNGYQLRFIHEPQKVRLSWEKVFWVKGEVGG